MKRRGGAVSLEQPDRLRVLVVDDYAEAADSLALLLTLWTRWEGII